MRRRKILAASAATASSTAFLAACVGGSQFEVVDIECETIDGGYVDVLARVQNLTGSTQRGTLVGEMSLDSGGTYTRERSIEMIDGEIITYDLTVNPPTSEPPSEDQYQCDAWIE